MDQSEQLSSPAPKELKDFEPQQHLNPLENYAISASVELIVDGKKVLVGEGKEATTVQQLRASHPELVSLPAGVINADVNNRTRVVEAINVTRASKFQVDAYLGMYGPEMMLKMMMREVSGGLVLSPIVPDKTADLEVFLQNEQGYLTEPPKLAENFSDLVEFGGTRILQDPNGKDVTALVYRQLK